MNKKFLSVILFSALMVGTAGTFTSCKDYDDDIKDLQGQLDKKASLDDLNAKVATLQTAVDEAKTAANEAKAKAQEALDKAGSSEGGVSEADLEKLQDALEKSKKEGSTFKGNCLVDPSEELIISLDPLLSSGSDSNLVDFHKNKETLERDKDKDKDKDKDSRDNNKKAK